MFSLALNEVDKIKLSLKFLGKEIFHAFSKDIGVSGARGDVIDSPKASFPIIVLFTV